MLKSYKHGQRTLNGDDDAIGKAITWSIPGDSILSQRSRKSLVSASHCDKCAIVIIVIV